MGGRAQPAIHLDAETFVDQAKAGDVVLMANTTHVSHLIRYGTRRPFSHAGLVIDDEGTMRSAYPGHDEPPKPVHDDPLRTLLHDAAGGGGAHKFDEVFLLRPQFSAEQVAKVIEESGRLAREAKSFHQFDIARLVMMLLCQEPYRGDQVKPVDHHRFRDGALIRYLLEHFADMIEADDDATSLVCSEFVYRSFAAAGIKLDIPNPIVRLGPPTPDVPTNPSAPADSALNVGLVRGRLNGLRDQIDEAVDDVQDWAVERLEDLAEVWDKVEGFVSRFQAARAKLDETDAELITPGDLIGSPDLVLKAVYFRSAWYDDLPPA